MDHYMFVKTDDFQKKHFQDIRTHLEAIKSPANTYHIFIKSIGGNPYWAFESYFYLKSLEGIVNTYLHSKVMSATVILFLAGQKRYSTSPADEIMIHGAKQSIKEGLYTSEDILTKYNIITSTNLKCANLYQTETKSFTIEKWLELMKNETYFVGKDLIDHGFIHKVDYTLKPTFNWMVKD
jgi:ATP-dependent protease ClpP protease subunit